MGEEDDPSLQSDDPVLFEQAKTRKQLLKQGIHLFNAKPQQGLEFLIQSGFIENSVESIAAFLKSKTS